MRCPICKQEIKDNSKFCSKCGNVVPRCPSCGKVIDKKVRFCVYDGAPLTQELTALLPEEPLKESGVLNKRKKRWPLVLVLILVLLLTSAVVVGYLLHDSGKINLFGKSENVSETEIYTEEEILKQEIVDEADTEKNEDIIQENSPEVEATENNDLESILETMQEVSEITKVIWGAYSKYLDQQDVIQAKYFSAENWPFKCVIYPGVNSIQDFEEVLKTYYTDNVVADFLSIIQYVEQNGKLYIAEADGLGGLDVDEYKVHITHNIAEIYEINIISRYVGEEVDEIPEKVNYRLTENGWRFDQGIVFWSDAPMMLDEEVRVYNQESDESKNERIRNSICMGESTSAVITEDGSLYMWGDNNYGQVGKGNLGGSYDNQLSPIKILADVVTVCMGKDRYESRTIHCGAITEDGSLYVWGENEYQRIGNGKTTSRCYSSPTKILSDVVEVCLGRHYGGAITKDGNLYMWGSNEHGQLGNGNTEDQLMPVKVLSNVVKISVGEGHSGAITGDGSLYMWGDNSSGQIGNGGKEEQLTPVKVLSNVVDIGVDSGISGAITEDGSLYMWGNYFNTGTGVTQYTPVKILSNVEKFDLTRSNAGAITEDGSLYMWGTNISGTVGNGVTKSQDTPIKILSDVIDFDISEANYSGAITEDGSLYMWGWNNWGQIGNGTTEDQLFPTKVLSDVAMIRLGGIHSAATKKDGSLYVWGWNRNGQVGNGTTEKQLTPIKILENVVIPDVALRDKTI